MKIDVTVDLRSKVGGIRDQGQRPTCMAFAASDAHASSRGTADPLSVEFAYFHAVQRQPKGDRSNGVSFPAIRDALLIDGQPVESGWPYIQNLSTADAWEPPDNPGDLFRPAAINFLGGIADIYPNLDAGHPVVVVTTISNSFFTITAGTLLQAPATESAVGTHAVIAMGYGESGGAKCLLIRNSWGTGWADGGYAWIREDYLIPRLLIAGTIK